jgi:hypothetical protein
MSDPRVTRHGLHVGLMVFDRSGQLLGRIDEVRRADPMAIADDGRRIGDLGDLVALLPGRYVRQLPLLPPVVAARLIRDGYVRIFHHDGRHFHYAGLPEVDEILDDGVHLRVSAADVAMT